MMEQEISLLLIDDDVAFRTRLAKSFHARGYIARQASNLAEVEECLKNYAPTHAVIDLCLKRESGLEAVSMLCQKYSSKVVVLTGYSSAPTALEAVRRGAVNYLSKPVSLEDLMGALFGAPLAPLGKASKQNAPTLAELEWEHIQRVMLECDGNVTHAAKRLGLHRQALQRKLRSKEWIRCGSK